MQTFVLRLHRPKSNVFAERTSGCVDECFNIKWSFVFTLETQIKYDLLTLLRMEPQLYIFSNTNYSRRLMVRLHTVFNIRSYLHCLSQHWVSSKVSWLSKYCSSWRRIYNTQFVLMMQELTCLMLHTCRILQRLEGCFPDVVWRWLYRLQVRLTWHHFREATLPPRGRRALMWNLGGCLWNWGA